jgi:hypothetical protein
MKKASLRGVRPIIKNHPILGRLLVAASLVTAPALWVALALRESWPEFRREYGQGLRLAFLPWEDDR